MKESARGLGFLAFLVVLAGGIRVNGLQEPPKPGPEEDPKAPELTPEQKQVLTLFNASKATFKDGNLVLEYNFESKNQTLVDDWQPALDKVKGRIRWAKGIEGTPTSIEDGIIIGDQGQWLHKAEFLPNVEVKVEMMSVAAFRSGTLVAPIFYSPKKKLAIGAHGGQQLVCLKGLKLAKPPHPKEEKPIQSNNRQIIGYKLHGGLLEACVKERKTADSTAVPKLTDGFDSGHVGLAWNGSVQCFIYKVTVVGQLNPTWLAKELKTSASAETPRK